jgi:hypothetical protein
VQLHLFFTSTLAGDKWSVSHSGRFTLGGKTTGTHRVRSLLRHRAGLIAVKKRKAFWHYCEFNSDSSFQAYKVINIKFVRIIHAQRDSRRIL